MFQTFPVLRILRRILQGAVEMRWSYALAITLAHASSTYIGLALCGETELISGWIQFAYYYVVTGSSVGYGDFSPSSDVGKLFVTFWVLPGAMALFGVVLGKIVATISNTMRKIMNGFGNFSDKTGHIVVLGHIPGQTNRLLDETRRLHGNRDVIIVATSDIAGSQDGWTFIRATSLSQRSDIERAGIRGADFVVILGKSDDESMAACLGVSALAPKGHVVAYFREDSIADLVRPKCPDIEIITSTSVEQVARALTDPGAGQVLHNLSSTKKGATMASLTFRGAAAVDTGTLTRWMRKEHRASFLGYVDAQSGEKVMDFGDDEIIQEGQTIFYVAKQRLPEALKYTGPALKQAA